MRASQILNTGKKNVDWVKGNKITIRLYVRQSMPVCKMGRLFLEHNGQQSINNSQ